MKNKIDIHLRLLESNLRPDHTMDEIINLILEGQNLIKEYRQKAPNLEIKIEKWISKIGKFCVDNNLIIDISSKN